MTPSWGDRLTRAAVAARAIGSTCLLGACLVAPRVAYADGALAIGLPPDVATQGISMAIYVNAASPDEAKALALKNCQSAGSPTSRSLCRVVATFKNQCAAEALDPKDGTPGFGWAIADTAEETKRRAIANCRDTAGPDRRDACVVPDKVWCDGRPN